MKFVSMFQCRNQKCKIPKEFKIIQRKLSKVQIVKERNLILFSYFSMDDYTKTTFPTLFQETRNQYFYRSFYCHLTNICFEINHFDSALNLENDQKIEWKSYIIVFKRIKEEIDFFFCIRVWLRLFNDSIYIFIQCNWHFSIERRKKKTRNQCFLCSCLSKLFVFHWSIWIHR